MRWAEVQSRRHWIVKPTPVIDPEKVACIVAPTMRHAEVWCRDRGLPNPRRRAHRSGDVIVVTNIDNAQRLRGLEFEPDAELVVVDRYRCKAGVIEEAEGLFRICKARSTRATRRGATRTVIPRGESELSY